MIMYLYTVYDKVAEEAGPVFQAINDGIAMRQFKSLGIPEALEKDYTLHRIGQYDSKNMEVIPEIVYHLKEDKE